MKEWLDGRVDDINTQPPEEQSLSQITEISLHLQGNTIIYRIPPWLGLFPNLRKVSLSTWGAFRNMKESNKVAYVRLVQKACPKVVVIGLDYVTERVEEWLKLEKQW